MREHYEKATFHYDQKRWEAALAEYEKHIAEYPEDSTALAMMALCYMELEIYGTASELASSAIAANPGDAYPYYVNSLIFRERNLREDAVRAIDSALELSPMNPDFLVARARLYLDEAQWLQASDLAAGALEDTPFHIGALSVRAEALVRLGQLDEAEALLHSAIEQEPENEYLIGQLGWFSLRKSDHKEALAYFQAALRIDPELETAREGLMQALRSQYPLYGILLRYFFWMNRHSVEIQRQISTATFFLVRLLRMLVEKNPRLAVVIGPLLVVWRMFSYLSWTARAATTLLLRLHPYARDLVEEDEKFESSLVGLCWLGAALVAAYNYFVDPFTNIGRVGVPVFMTLPLLFSSHFTCPTGAWPHKVSIVVTSIMSFCALVGLLAFGIGQMWGIKLLVFYFQALVWVLMASSFLHSVEPTKE